MSELKKANPKAVPSASKMKSKTPPVQRKLENSNSATSLKPRILPMRTKSMIALSSSNYRPAQLSKNQGTKEELQKLNPAETDLYHLTYNAYLQTCLMHAHKKQIEKEASEKLVQEVEDINTKLIIHSDELNFIEINLEKVSYLKNIKQVLTQKIEDLKKIKNLIDEADVDGQTILLENCLRKVNLKQFLMPNTENDAEEVNHTLQELANKLQDVSKVKEQIQPLIDVRTTLLRTKEFIDNEESIVKRCQEKLERANELVYEKLCAIVLKANHSGIEERC